MMDALVRSKDESTLGSTHVTVLAKRSFEYNEKDKSPYYCK